MAIRIDELIQVEYASKLKEALLINERNAAEMAGLQAQINPHFIYNTLDTIKWLMRYDHKNDCERAINALARLMRYSMKIQQPMVTIADEMHMVQAYGEIQALRTNASPDIIFRVPPALQSNVAVRMLFQPIMENIYAHAFESHTIHGVILIVVSESQDGIEVQIEDNGCGISKNALELLRQKIATPIPDERRGIGLYNVNRRIQLHFGDAYGLSIDSTPDRGTCVIIRLPRMTPEGAHETKAM